MAIERMLIPSFKLSPCSQAIYGSSVETFGPYPQDYTMYTKLLRHHFINSLIIRRQEKKRTFFMSVF